MSVKSVVLRAVAFKYRHFLCKIIQTLPIKMLKLIYCTTVPRRLPILND